MGLLKKTIIGTIIGLVLALIYIWLAGLFAASELSEKLKIACDGFFFAGGILFCVGILILCNSEGTFDLIFFSVKKMSVIFLPFKRFKSLKEKSFAEYKEERMAVNKAFLHIVLAGLVHIIIAVIFLLAYYRAV